MNFVWKIKSQNFVNRLQMMNKCKWLIKRFFQLVVFKIWHMKVYSGLLEIKTKTMSHQKNQINLCDSFNTFRCTTNSITN